MEFNIKKIIMLLLLAFTVQTYAAVTVTDSGSTVTLDNGTIAAVFNKATGNMTSLTKAASPELLAGEAVDLTVMTNAGVASFSTSSVSYQLISQSSSSAEISFSVSSSTAMPFDAELHYILRDNESGIYWYAKFNTQSGSAKELQEVSLLASLDPVIFSNYCLTDSRVGQFPSPADVSNGTELVPNGAKLLAGGSVNYKYITHNKEDESPVYGLYGSDGGSYLGVWMITPSYESINGGHNKQNLAVYQTETAPRLIRMLQSSDFGGKNLVFETDEQWSKLYGPFMLYVNTASDSESLWNDAKVKASSEQNAYPYSWMSDADFEFYTRGSFVSGTLNLTDGTDPTDAWVGLIGGDDTDNGFAQTGKGYQFWSQVQPNGSFAFNDVRAQLIADGQDYTLYAHIDGIMQEYKKTGIVFPPRGGSIGTINWTPEKHGKTLWQIGYADRSAAEFRKGDNLSQWGLWLDFPTDFPNSVNYIIAQSNPATDWNYAQCTVGWQEPYTEPQNLVIPDWNITFDIASPPANAIAKLSVAIASSSLDDSSDNLTIAINGTVIETFYSSDLHYGDAMSKTSHYGFASYQVKTIEFDGSLIQQGLNIITLSCQGDQFDAIMYDSLKLELLYTADINEDGEVDLGDLGILVEDWLK